MIRDTAQSVLGTTQVIWDGAQIDLGPYSGVGAWMRQFAIIILRSALPSVPIVMHCSFTVRDSRSRLNRPTVGSIALEYF